MSTNWILKNNHGTSQQYIWGNKNNKNIKHVIVENKKRSPHGNAFFLQRT